MPLFDSLYRYARCLAEDRGEAEDLVQETYLKGLRGFASFRTGTNFRAWMFRILRNTFLTSRSGLRAVPPLPAVRAAIRAGAEWRGRDHIVAERAVERAAAHLAAPALIDDADPRPP